MAETKKRKDECFICKKRNCHHRIVREEYPYFDEIACHEHVENLEKYSDAVLGKDNGILRIHMWSMDKLKRGDKINE